MYVECVGGQEGIGKDEKERRKQDSEAISTQGENGKSRADKTRPNPTIIFHYSQPQAVHLFLPRQEAKDALKTSCSVYAPSTNGPIY
jgi:hypothetical protein